jgi:hypothetical protein
MLAGTASSWHKSHRGEVIKEALLLFLMCLALCFCNTKPLPCYWKTDISDSFKGVRISVLFEEKKAESLKSGDGRWESAISALQGFNIHLSQTCASVRYREQSPRDQCTIRLLGSMTRAAQDDQPKSRPCASKEDATSYVNLLDFSRLLESLLIL